MSLPFIPLLQVWPEAEFEVIPEYVHLTQSVGVQES